MILPRVLRLAIGKTWKERRQQKAAFLERHGSLNGYELYAASAAAAYISPKRSSYIPI